MGRYRRKYRSHKTNSGPNPIGAVFFLTILLFYKHWKTILILAALLFVLFIIFRYLLSHKNKPDTVGKENADLHNKERLSDTTSVTYASKDSIMTDCEKSFYSAIKDIITPEYIVQPQINLASVIDKTSHTKYRTELFRNVDFGIFDKNYRLLVLIEINDQSHDTRNRASRDQKVKEICAEANIPLITLWTKYGVNPTYIRERLSSYIALE